MNDDTPQRKAFEEWISYRLTERDVLRYPQDETKFAWPGQYQSSHVQIAWEAWQESSATTIERFLKGLANKQ